MKNITPFMWRKGITLSATFLFALFLIVSCKKKISKLGESSINQSEVLSSNGVDTFSLITYTVNDDMDSLATSSAIYGVLGSYNDPVFGTMNAEIYTEIKLKAFNPDFGDISGISIDSVVLGMQYAGSYGDAGNQTVQVYELSDTMSLYSTYYATSTVGNGIGASQNLVFDPNGPLGASTKPTNPYNFNENTVTVVGNDTLAPQLRIHLDDSFAWKIINEANNNPQSFESNENFKEFYKGLHIRTNNGYQTPGTGGVFYFDLNDTYSKVTIYYTQDGISRTYDLLINSQTAKFNHVDIDHSGTNIANVLADSTLGMDQFYAQAFGSRAIVGIPSLDDIPANSIIHKATLEVPVSYQTGTKYAPSDDIAVTIMLEDGNFGFYTFAGYDNFKKSYSIDLRAYAQAVVNKDLENTGIALSPVLYITSGDRIIFNGVNSTNKDKPRLNIVYTEF